MPLSFFSDIAYYRELQDAESDLDFERVLHQVRQEWRSVHFAVSNFLYFLFSMDSMYSWQPVNFHPRVSNIELWNISDHDKHLF